MTYRDLRHRIGLRYGYAAAQFSQDLANLVDVAKMVVGEADKDGVSKGPESFEDAQRQFSSLFGG